MKGGDNNGILIHSPLATRVGVHLKDNWTPTLTNMRQRVDIKNWTSAFTVTLLTAIPIGRKETNARQKMALFRADPSYCITILASVEFLKFNLNFYLSRPWRHTGRYGGVAPLLLNVDNRMTNVVIIRSRPH